MTFIPTRAAGLDQLMAFVGRAGRDYAETRNFDHGPENRTNVSQLSPYLRYRLITEDEVVAAVRSRHPGDTADKFVQEVLWRTYWKGWLALRPSVWTTYLADVERLDEQTGGWRRDYEKAIAGRTGIDCFDAWIGELIEHGYLHNHARMWLASIWIFTLRLPWQLGAALFWRHLLDGDPASNTLSWRWVAGLQTVGKTYLAQGDNIARYTGGRFNPVGLATRAAALEAPASPLPVLLALPDPVPAGRIGLLLGEDDLTPETLALGDAKVVATASLGGDFGRSRSVEAFVSEALGDALSRAAAAFAVPGASLPDATVTAVGNWAAVHGIERIAVAYPPTGPGAGRLAALSDSLRLQGVTVHSVRRRWDVEAWPHAQRGFFAFRERFRT